MRAGLPAVIRHRLDPQARYGLRVTLFGLAVVLVTVPFAYLLFEVLAEGPLTRIDGDIADSLNHWVHRRQTLLHVLEGVSWLGKPLWLGIAVGAASIYVYRHGRRRLAVYLAVTVIGGGLVDTAVKLAVDRPRPLVDHPIHTAWGKSFPSGHSMSSTVTYGALLLVFLPVLSRRLRPVAFAGGCLLVLAIGTSRLLLGVHFVTDVVGGYVLGLAWLFASTAAFSIWRQETGKPPVHPVQGVEPEAAEDLKPHESSAHASA
jgi:undecaprenyl-diphosphatase